MVPKRGGAFDHRRNIDGLPMKVDVLKAPQVENRFTPHEH
jgi:hypothetical protein